MPAFYKYTYEAEADAVFGGNFTILQNKLAERVSRFIQGKDNPSYTNSTGNIFDTEIYIQVRWPWIILPVATLVLSIIILVLTIYDSQSRPYMLKNSIITALFVHFQGWDEHEQLEKDKYGRYSAGAMVQASKKTKVAIDLGEEDGEGIKLKMA